MLVLIPALVLAGGQVGAGSASISAPSQVAAGERIQITGGGFPSKALLQVAWNGDSSGMPAAKAGPRGDLRVRFQVPTTAAAGVATIEVHVQGIAGTAGPVVATASVQVVVAGPTSVATVQLEPQVAAPTAASSATTTPQPTPGPTGTPQATATPVAQPATAQPATPAPTAQPATPPPPTAVPTPQPVTLASAGRILISSAELMALPTSGAAWDALVASSNALGSVNLADQDEHDDVRLLARALVTVRTGGDVRPIHDALARIPGTEAGGRTLALGRNLASVVLAADLVGYRDPAFATWLRGVLRTSLDGRTLISTHEERPNNWGTHAGASRIAAALYLGDTADLGRAAAVFRGWLGERSVYAGFNYGELDWQANASAPVGINPRGATRNGHSIDGVLPDDQRRAGGFSWPPPKENYVYEALQGALLQAELLTRAGYPAYGWGDQALKRAYAWLYTQAGYPAEGDDTWQPHLVNYRYGTSYPAPIASQHGKNFGFTDWLYRR